MDYSQRRAYALELVKQDKYPDALCECAILLKEDPKDQEIIELIVFLFSRIQEGNLDFQPETSDEFVMRGNSRLYNNQLVESVDDYNIAIRIKEDNDYAYKSLAFSLRFLGRYDEAIVNIERAISINPAGEYFDDLAEIFEMVGDLDLAFDNHQKAVKASPAECRLWYNFGVHLMHRGVYKEGLEKFNRAIELWPLYDDAIYNRDWIIQNCKL